MQLVEFADCHEAKLLEDPARYNLLTGLMARFRTWSVEEANTSGVMIWTLGTPGQCALKMLGFPLLLGNLTQAQARAFAETTKDLDYNGVVGNDETTFWFCDQAQTLGIAFEEPISQPILALTSEPNAPDAPGSARRVQADDFDVFRAWMHAFVRETVPHDPVPDDDTLKANIDQGRFWFWIADGAPVSLAAVGRRTRKAGAINSVYTPPSHRSNGFAGAVVAEVARQIFAEGREVACLYVHADNPASNRCYAKLGFKQVCDSWYVLRRAS